MGLVQYDSSDEDEEVQVPVEPKAQNPAIKPLPSNTQNPPEPEPPSAAPSTPAEPPQNGPSPAQNAAPGPVLGPMLGPALGPARPPTDSSLPDVDLSFLDAPPQPESGQDPQPPRSPYTATRTLLRDLTLPSHANMEIPPSPPGTPPPSHSALTEKFTTFLRLKNPTTTTTTTQHQQQQPIHFNARLAASQGMKNPAVTDKLLAFIGIDTADFPPDSDPSHPDTDTDGPNGTGKGGVAQYSTLLSREVCQDAGAFPAWAYRGALRRAQEKGGKERERGRGEKVEFVKAASSSAAGEVGTSMETGTATAGTGTGTPGVGGGVGGGSRRAGRWDK